MKKYVIIEYTKEIIQLIFFVMIVASIIIPNSLSFWSNDGL